MEKIVGGLRFTGEPVENCFDVRTWVCNGVMERTARQVIEWTESSLLDDGYPDIPFDDPDPVKDAEWIEEQRLKSLKASARRAKTVCRRFIIHENFDEMLTLTYRENQTDRVLCKVHFEKWCRRMKKALGGFRFCASFEAQERGAMHIHCATHRLPPMATYKGAKVKAWQVGTRIWRDIVGENNGMCFVGGRNKFGAPRAQKMSLAKMAGYVSKYILKDCETLPPEANRYSRSNGHVDAEIYTVRLSGSLAEVIAASFECKDGDVMVSHHVSTWSNSWWLCTEREKKPGSSGSVVEFS